MTLNSTPPPRTPLRTAVACLRVVVLLQCLGVCGRYYFSPNETESDVYGLLFFDYGWPEAVAQQIDDFGVFACGVAGCLLLLSPLLKFGPDRDAKLRLRAGEVISTSAGFVVAAWMLALAATHMVRGDLYAEWALAEQAVRYTAPLAVVFLAANHPGGQVCSPAQRLGIWLLLAATAATFVAHGYKAFHCYSPFIDLLLLTDAGWFGLNLSQSTAETALVVIGVVDILVAVLLLTTRWRSVAVYMVLWGLITAASRMTAFGAGAWPETLIRSANWGAPLALVVSLCYLRAVSPLDAYSPSVPRSTLDVHGLCNSTPS